MLREPGQHATVAICSSTLERERNKQAARSCRRTDMPKKKVRRSISMRPEVYCRLEDLAKLGVVGDALSQIVESAITALCDEHGIPPIDRGMAVARILSKATPPPPPDPIISQHFTF